MWASCRYDAWGSRKFIEEGQEGEPHDIVYPLTKKSTSTSHSFDAKRALWSTQYSILDSLGVDATHLWPHQLPNNALRKLSYTDTIVCYFWLVIRRRSKTFQTDTRTSTNWLTTKPWAFIIGRTCAANARSNCLASSWSWELPLGRADMKLMWGFGLGSRSLRRRWTIVAASKFNKTYGNVLRHSRWPRQGVSLLLSGSSYIYLNFIRTSIDSLDNSSNNTIYRNDNLILTKQKKQPKQKEKKGIAKPRKTTNPESTLSCTQAVSW